MAKKILSVFGDEFFPKIGKGGSERERQNATSNILEFFKTVQPDLVYIMPTKGTCAYVSMLCSILQIPYIMVGPYPNFYDNVRVDDKICIRKAMDDAKSFILVNEGIPSTRAVGEQHYYDSVEFLCKVSSAIVFFYSKDTTLEYKAFMDTTCDKAKHKHLWELVYDSRKMLGE